jgi:putative two-component system response regulator
VHDIGKVVVPDAILLKPGPLSEDEAEVVRKHPVVEERICAPLRTFRLVLPIIRHHHERHDGTGYPDGLRGAEIPLTAGNPPACRCVRALTTGRSYRSATSSEVALDKMDEEAARGWRVVIGLLRFARWSAAATGMLGRPPSRKRSAKPEGTRCCRHPETIC